MGVKKVGSAATGYYMAQRGPQFGDIYKVEWFDNRPDERRWMFVSDHDHFGSRFTMMVADGTFAGIMTHWDSLAGFVRVEE